ncbi:flagellar hook-length control protein FliK [Photobacterium alginatilyticum]|uniref:Flagellar hook-length control protein FliK n=1 Tax=Photobacterium alginatilyticum TaxID=1775171 RepID=A0ABW9YMU7_9GAMM|nr:flagellar hook-length control protein FliK [Photobacterium alginatilyticum]NBI55164.1 flagellar hook-length control protein FliK [Photobacterium alginatilyticum]
MQVSANVAVKTASQTSSTDSRKVQPNSTGDSEPMSFAEFEQRLDKSAGTKDESKASDDSSEESAQPLSADAQTQGQQDKPAEATAMNQAQQGAQNGSSAAVNNQAGSVTGTATTPQFLAAQNQALQSQMAPAGEIGSGVVSGREAGSQANPLLTQLAGQNAGQNVVQTVQQNMAQHTGQAAQQAPVSPELLEQMQHLLKQQKPNTGDALSLAKGMTMPLDGALNDKLTAGVIPMSVQSAHSSLVASGSNLSAPASGSPASAAQQLYAGVDVTQPEWGRDLVEQLRSRMQLSKTDQIQHAHVRLDPPELGRLEVNLRLDGDKVSVHFTAAHPQLREALAANADKLRFDFDGSQMQLADVSVSSGLYQQSHQHSGTDDEPGIMANQGVIESEEASAAALGLDGRYEAMV